MPPTLSKISANFFINLINRLGVRPPPPDAFLLSNVVQPVSIVDADITLAATVTTQLLGTPFTAGELSGPGANTILADTGAQGAGNYDATIMFDGDFNANEVVNTRLERRNAANGANIWSQIFNNRRDGNSYRLLRIRLTLADQERLRVRLNAALTAGHVIQVSIWLNQTT